MLKRNATVREYELELFWGLSNTAGTLIGFISRKARIKLIENME